MTVSKDKYPNITKAIPNTQSHITLNLFFLFKFSHKFYLLHLYKITQWTSTLKPPLPKAPAMHEPEQSYSELIEQ